MGPTGHMQPPAMQSAQLSRQHSPFRHAACPSSQLSEIYLHPTQHYSHQQASPPRIDTADSWRHRPIQMAEIYQQEDHLLDLAQRDQALSMIISSSKARDIAMRTIDAVHSSQEAIDMNQVRSLDQDFRYSSGADQAETMTFRPGQSRLRRDASLEGSHDYIPVSQNQRRSV